MELVTHSEFKMPQEIMIIHLDIESAVCISSWVVENNLKILLWGITCCRRLKHTHTYVTNSVWENPKMLLRVGNPLFRRNMLPLHLVSQLLPHSIKIFWSPVVKQR